MHTTLEFYNNLKETISFLDIEKKFEDKQVYLPEAQTKMLNDFFLSGYKHIPENLIKTMIAEILKNPDANNGKVYEALVYAWLEKHGIQYTPQVHVKQENCFKESTNGYDVDGVIEDNGLIFDVKQFGLALPHIDTLRRKIQAYIPEDYYLTISGGRNISAKDLQTHFLEKAKTIAQYIMDEKKRVHTDYIYCDTEFNLEFRAWKRKGNPFFTSISEFNIYEWAEKNEFYFMYHASQFCINSPYVLFCPYDKYLVPLFSGKDRVFTFGALRALCRRIFMNLTKMDERRITDFDGKARNGISVATAAKKISAIVFLDVSEEFDYHNCHMFVFQNPNADNKIPRYQINSLFRNAGAIIEDFNFDNY